MAIQQQLTLDGMADGGRSWGGVGVAGWSLAVVILLHERTPDVRPGLQQRERQLPAALVERPVQRRELCVAVRLVQSAPTSAEDTGVVVRGGVFQSNRSATKTHILLLVGNNAVVYSVHNFVCVLCYVLTVWKWLGGLVGVLGGVQEQTKELEPVLGSPGPHAVPLYIGYQVWVSAILQK